MSGKKLLSIVLLICSSLVLHAEVKDSVGTKVKNGLVYIMHKVDPGQGLYSIGRRYGIPYKKIIAANPGSAEKLLAGQIILVPTGKKAPMEDQVVKEYFEDKKPTKDVAADPRIKKKSGVRSTFAKFHTVKSGETLYAIAQKYKTSTKVLMDLNEMKSSALNVGQKILVPIKEEEAKSTDKKVENSEKKIDDIKKEAKEVKEELDRRNDNLETPISAPSKYSKKVDKMPEFDVEKISEIGNLTFSDENELRSNKKVASHHEAKIGSTIMVTNPANNKAIFVKVVKNHSMDAEKANMIMIPGAVASKIGLQNGQSVTTSYAR
jgi:LysM repeat protein